LFGKLLKETMDRLGIRCEVYAGRTVPGVKERISIVDFISQEFAKVSPGLRGRYLHLSLPHYQERRR
jgi:hypothetical protein